MQVSADQALTYSFRLPLATLPSVENIYLDVFASAHGCEEFFYSNLPNDAASDYGFCGGGIYREVCRYIHTVILYHLYRVNSSQLCDISFKCLLTANLLQLQSLSPLFIRGASTHCCGVQSRAWWALISRRTGLMTKSIRIVLLLNIQYHRWKHLGTQIRLDSVCWTLLGRPGSLHLAHSAGKQCWWILVIGRGLADKLRGFSTVL